jgi:ATP-dependent exoDNAse (exonuclease V) beta subunit
VLVDPELGVLPELTEERIDDEGTEKTKVRSSVYQLARWAASDQEEAESDRLLYVAATRAKEMLLVSGVVNRGLDGWLSRLDASLSLTEALSSEIDQESNRVQRVDLAAGVEPVACWVWPDGVESTLPIVAPLANEPFSARDLPAELPLLAPLTLEQVVIDEKARKAVDDPPQRVWRVVPQAGRARAPAWVVGQIVHYALEHWAFPSTTTRDWHTWAASEAHSCGITDAGEARDAVRRAERMLSQLQATPIYAEMQHAERRLHEVPYAVADTAGRLEQGTIDALYWTGEEWVLVEFKTDWIADEAKLEEKLATQDYVKQVARYLDAAERTLGARPRPVLCLLNYQRTVRLVEGRW